MRIAVMGAGAVGGYVGGRLAATGASVHFIARGAHLAALQRGGLRIETPQGTETLAVDAASDPAEIGPVDLVLFAVKLGATETAARALAPLLAGHTRIVTLQNGIDVKAMIARYVEVQHIAAGCIYITVSIRSPGVVHWPGGVTRLVVDHLDGDTTIAAFVACCQQVTGLDVAATDDIRQALWDKFVTLVAFSGATCLTRGPIGAVLKHPESVAFLRRILAENLAVGRAEGVSFAPDRVDRTVEFFSGLPPAAKSSMLLDLEAGKPLEVPWLSGRMLALGKTHGIETPANAAVAAALAPHSGGSAQTLSGA